MALECPRCGLLSPDKSLQCECGQALDGSGALLSPLGPAAQRAAAEPAGPGVASGVILLLLGIGLTLGSMAVSKGGGGTRYILFTGLIASGVISIVRSLAAGASAPGRRP